MYDKNLMSASTTMLVLSILNEGDGYGYSIIKALEQRSENAFSLKEGTLYPILHGLENQGLVSSYEMTDSGRKRKYYHLTDSGRKAYQDKLAEWESFSYDVNKVIYGDALPQA